MGSGQFIEREDRAWVRRMLVRWGNVNRICTQLNRELEAMAQIKYRMVAYGDEEEQRRIQDVLKELDGNIRQLTESCRMELKFSRAFGKRLMAVDGSLRKILFMRYWDDYSYLQIANRLNKSIDHVKRKEAKAVDELCAVLRGE